MAIPTVRKVEMEDGSPAPVNQNTDINEKIKKDVEAKIKSRFMDVDAVNGRAQMFDTKTHVPGVDYTAGGQLATRWVTNDDANINAKRLKGFLLPSEVSSHLKDINMGGMTLMVRSVTQQREHTESIEKLNKSWEAKARAKTSPKAGQGLGEFEVTPQSAVRG